VPDILGTGYREPTYWWMSTCYVQFYASFTRKWCNTHFHVYSYAL